MLQLRPNCECCNRDLPPDSVEAVSPADRLAKHPASTERVYKPAGCGKPA